MHLGIFAKTFPRPTLEATLDAIANRGLTHVQFNMSCCGLPTLPRRIDEDLGIWVARSFRERGLTMAAISGTFNLCDPDAGRLRENLDRLRVLAAACRWLDTRIITLCTGTRDPEDMWKWHPDNVRRDTWNALRGSMCEAGMIADRHEVTLAFEPEVNNVVNSVARARMLLDEVDSPWLKVLIDPANLLRTGEFPRMTEVLDEAFDWLGPDIVLAHAKEPSMGLAPDETITVGDYLRRTGGCPSAIPTLDLDGMIRQAAALPQRRQEILAIEVPRQLVELEHFYRSYVGQLRRLDFEGSVVMHGIAEDRVEPLGCMIDALIVRSESAN